MLLLAGALPCCCLLLLPVKELIHLWNLGVTLPLTAAKWSVAISLPPSVAKGSVQPKPCHSLESCCVAAKEGACIADHRHRGASPCCIGALLEFLDQREKIAFQLRRCQRRCTNPKLCCHKGADFGALPHWSCTQPPPHLHAKPPRHFPEEFLRHIALPAGETSGPKSIWREERKEKVGGISLVCIHLLTTAPRVRRFTSSI